MLWLFSYITWSVEILGVLLIIVFLLSEVRGFLMKREADNHNISDLE